MSSFEELRDQWIHDHVPSATLSLHYVFEAAETRIAALEAKVERLKSFEIYEVFTAADGEPATRPVNWPEKVAELEAFKRDVCRRASQDQHGWSAWVAGWQRREDS